MSAYSIAKSQVSEALRIAATDGVDEDILLRAIIGTVAEHYRALKGVSDLEAVLQYELDNASGEEDHEFMRP